MTDNKHKVPKKQWKKWNEKSQDLFNGLYEHMGENQSLYLHPHTIMIPNDYWNTTAWNAAFMAAELNRFKEIPNIEEQHDQEEAERTDS